ncbi:MAG: hypothetical protein QXT40_01795 [Candidatus Micrarchaeia archaeon]
MLLDSGIVAYILIPILVFIGILLFWFIQSVVLLFVARKFIFPSLYKHKLTEWFVVEFAIAIHELSHLFAALFTGSEINLKESFVTSKEGRIAARSSQSIGGWISIIIAAFAPAFIPSLVLFILSIILFQVNIPIYKVLEAKPNIGLESYISILSSILLPLVNLLLSLIISPSLFSVIFIYFMIISSLTSAPSEDDWKASYSVLFSFPVIPLLIVFILLNFVSIQFNFNLLLFILTILSIVFLFILFGILFNLMFVILIKLLERLWSLISAQIRKSLKIYD